MNWSELLTPELVELSVFLASICTILIFVGMVVRYTITFFRNSQLPWQAWLELLLQIAIVILVFLYTKPSWIGTIVMWMIIARNLLNRKFYDKLIDGYNDTIREYKRLIKEALRDLELP